MWPFKSNKPKEITQQQNQQNSSKPRSTLFDSFDPSSVDIGAETDINVDEEFNALFGNNQHPKKKVQDKQRSVPVDMNVGLIDIDNMQIEISDEDLNNPDFLSELASFGIEFETTGAQLQVPCRSSQSENIVSISKPQTPVTGSNSQLQSQPTVDIKQLQAQAVSLKKEGRKEEALVIMRQLKSYQNGSVSVTDARINQINNIVTKSKSDISRNSNTMISSTNVDSNNSTESILLTNSRPNSNIKSTTIPHESNQVSSSTPTSIETQSYTFEQATMYASHHQHAGNITEANSWLKYAESLQPNPTSSTSISYDHAPVVPDVFKTPCVDMNIGLIDIDNVPIEISEEDLKNPDFLSELESYSGDGIGNMDNIDNNNDGIDKVNSDYYKNSGNCAISNIEWMNNATKTIWDDHNHHEPVTQLQVQNLSSSPSSSQSPSNSMIASTNVDSNNSTESITHKEMNTNTNTKATNIQLENPSQLSSSTSTSTSITQGQSSSSSLHHKEAGNVAEAFKWLEYAEHLKASLPPSTSTTSHVATYSEPSAAAVTVQPQTPVQNSIKMDDAFTPLERVLKDISQIALKDAKQYQEIDKKKALKCFKEYKYYEQELIVLQSRRNIPGAVPPLFQWEMKETDEIIQNIDIAENQIELNIISLENMENVLKDYSSRTINISYEIHLKENITGFLSSKTVLGIATLPLAELLHKCEYEMKIPLMKYDNTNTSSTSTSTSRKSIGGTLHVKLRLRTPVERAEVRKSLERVLVIQPWSETTLTTIPTTTTSSTSNNNHSIASTSNISQVPAPLPAVQTNMNTQPNKPAPAPAAAITGVTSSQPSQSPVKANPDFSRLSEQEKNNPLSVDFLISSDVMDAEVEALQAKLTKQQSALSEEEKIDLSTRLTTIQVKLSILVNQVQNDELSLEDYLIMLKKRLEQDRLLAVYCNTHGKKQEAIAITKRIIITQKEIKGVEDAQSGS
eukprot:gene5978-12055_t